MEFGRRCSSSYSVRLFRASAWAVHLVDILIIDAPTFVFDPAFDDAKAMKEKCSED